MRPHITLAASLLAFVLRVRERRIAGRIACAMFSLPALACECPPTIESSSPSPDNRLTAVTYTVDCGAMVPFNHRVGLKDSGSNAISDVVTILEIGWTAIGQWTQRPAGAT